MEPSEVLKNYLKKHEMSVDDFANLCRLSHTSIYNFLHGKPISRIAAFKIEKFTRSELSFSQLTVAEKETKKKSKPLKNYLF